MNKKEISELRRRFNPDKNNISVIRGCYVNARREIVSELNRSPLSLPQEENEKYMAIFKRALSGVPGKTLTDIVFRPDQVMDGAEHHLLMRLRETALREDESVQAFYRRVIDALELEGNYLILLVHDAYDVPGKADAFRADADGESETVFHSILCAVCPVKQGKSALSYFAEDREFHNRELDWVVAAPEMGFLFPAFDDRAANIYNALYYTRDAAENHPELVAALFGADAPMPAQAQMEAFQAVLAESLAEDLSYEVVRTVHEQLRDRIEEQKADKEAEPLTVSKREVKTLLEACGVPDERVAAFEDRYDEKFGKGMDLSAQSIVNPKQFELRTPDVTIRVSPGCGGLVETRVIDGQKYILVRADEGVEVNGVSVHIE